jgi:hypothetical protein
VYELITYTNAYAASPNKLNIYNIVGFHVLQSGKLDIFQIKV